MARLSLRACILSTTSVIAVMAVLGSQALACNPAGTFTGPGTFGAFSNSSTLDCVTITNHALVNGNVVNGVGGVIGSPGSPQPGALSIDASTINGSVQNSGHITASGGTLNGISVTGSSVVTNGIINNRTGTIGVSGLSGNLVGISVNQSSFSGNITNSGLITVTSGGGASASAVGIGIGGGVGGGLQPLNLKTTSAIKTTSAPGGVTPLSSGSSKGHGTHR
jgi:hypothetical protein